MFQLVFNLERKIDPYEWRPYGVWQSNPPRLYRRGFEKPGFISDRILPKTRIVRDIYVVIGDLEEKYEKLFFRVTKTFKIHVKDDIVDRFDL